MDLVFNTIYEKFAAVFQDAQIDLEEVKFFDPWAIGTISLKAIENKDRPDKKIKLPNVGDTRRYLARMHLGNFVRGLTYGDTAKELEAVQGTELHNPNVHEIFHCLYRDEFNGRLESGIRRMFRNFGMNTEDEQRATALVGELGNNVFDHNEGAWPTDIRGAIIVGQNYPAVKRIEVAVADPGVGFFGSLKAVTPQPKDDLDAIKLGLQGITGRIGEKRGNGLRLIQDWTIRQFNGILRIQSGNGLVEADRNGMKERTVHRILGTLAEFVVYYT